MIPCLLDAQLLQRSTGTQHGLVCVHIGPGYRAMVHCLSLADGVACDLRCVLLRGLDVPCLAVGQAAGEGYATRDRCRFSVGMGPEMDL